jgi:hypothetical protein
MLEALHFFQSWRMCGTWSYSVASCQSSLYSCKIELHDLEIERKVFDSEIKKKKVTKKDLVIFRFCIAFPFWNIYNLTCP